MTRLLLAPFLTLCLALVAVAAASPAAAETDPVGAWPLAPEPEVSAGFDPPRTAYGAGHRGVDLAGRVAQPVRAALPGTVSHAGPLAGRGVVVVSHGDTRTTYEPVTASVDVGDAVAEGDLIGTLALPRSHCFPRACLHWGWLRGETYLDPLRLVGGAGPVRLLPLWRDLPVDGREGRTRARPEGGHIGACCVNSVHATLPDPLPRGPQRAAPDLGVRLAGAPAGRRAAAGRW